MKLIRPTNITTEGGFTRNSIGTYFDANGVLQTAAVNEPRFNYDPETGEFQGLLIEGAATNLLLNSNVLSTQTVTVTSSVSYTLSFYGTGTITLSGANSSVVVGTGVFPSRRSFTFTTSSTSLTLTVVGTVEDAQLEAGLIATSYIPTVGTTVTRASDVVSGSGLVYNTIPENDYAEWDAATSYTLGQRVIRLTTHKVYENLIAGVNAGLPENTPTRWLEISPTNRWSMFDAKIGTQSTASNEMTIVLKPGRVNSLALLGLNAASVEIAMFADNQVVYSGSADLLSGNVVGDWYEYFYEPIYQKDSLVVTELFDTALLNLPAYGEGVITVRIKYPASTVQLGALIVGLSTSLGLTQYDASLGIIDYSIKEADAFGNVVVTPRAFSKRMSADIIVRNEAVDNVARVLTLYRSTPLVWVATENTFNSLVVYGFYKDWEIVVREPTVSTLRIEVEGLT